MNWIERLDEFTVRQGINSAEWCKILDGVENEIKELKDSVEQHLKYASQKNEKITSLKSQVQILKEALKNIDYCENRICHIKCNQITVSDALAKIKELEKQ